MYGPDSRNELCQAAIFSAARSGGVAWNGINTRWVKASGPPSVELCLDGVQLTIIGEPTFGFGWYLRPPLMNRARLSSTALPVTR